MAKKYFQGKTGFDLLTNKKPGLKSLIKTFLPHDQIMFLETENGALAVTPLIKIVAEDSLFNKIVSSVTSKNAKVTDLKGNKFIVAVGSDKFYLYKSGGRLQNVIDSEGNAAKATAPSTIQQEDGVRFALEYFASNNEYPSKESINKAVNFEFGKDWQESFKKTVDAILTVIPKTKISQYDFYRDSNAKKLKFLNQITDSKVLPDSKDNWNPSDIWAVKRSSVNSLSSAVETLYANVLSKKSSIEDLNKFVEEKMNSNDLIGISLKKVAGTKATISKIEVDSKYIKNIKYTKPTKKFNYKVSNSYFDFLLDFNVLGSIVNYRYRFRPRGASGELNTYGEGQPQSAKVWDGAISRDMLNTQFPGMVDITKEMKTSKSKFTTAAMALKTLATNKEFAEFSKYVLSNKFEFVEVTGLEDDMSDYEVRRSIVLLYYIYTLESAPNRPELFKKMYLAAKKMNDFSSVHYKVY